MQPREERHCAALSRERGSKEGWAGRRGAGRSEPADGGGAGQSPEERESTGRVPGP